jgi:hypothetical protein
MADRKLLVAEASMSNRKRECAVTIITVFLLMLAVNGCAFKGPYRCYLGNYSGRILDVDTGEPIEEAVFHVTYSMYGASAAGEIGTQIAVRETLTNANGEYHIPKETVSHECFSGKSEGIITIFKPGYGVLSHNRALLSCPDEEKEKIFSYDKEPRCVTVDGKYLIWELPKLETREEREDNLGRASPAMGISFDNQRLLIQAISQERRYLGYSD